MKHKRTGIICYVESGSRVSQRASIEIALYIDESDGSIGRYGEYTLGVRQAIRGPDVTKRSRIELSDLSAHGLNIDLDHYNLSRMPDIFHHQLFEEQLDLIEDHLGDLTYCSTALLECAAKFSRILPRLLEPGKELGSLESDIEKLLSDF